MTDEKRFANPSTDAQRPPDCRRRRWRTSRPDSPIKITGTLIAFPKLRENFDLLAWASVRLALPALQIAYNCLYSELLTKELLKAG